MKQAEIKKTAKYLILDLEVYTKSWGEYEDTSFWLYDRNWIQDNISLLDAEDIARLELVDERIKKNIPYMLYHFGMSLEKYRAKYKPSPDRWWYFLDIIEIGQMHTSKT